MQLTITKPVIKNKLKELLTALKTFKVPSIQSKIFHSSAKQIASNSDIDEAFKFTHQSIMTKIKIHASEDWVVIEKIVNYSIKIFEC